MVSAAMLALEIVAALMLVSASAAHGCGVDSDCLVVSDRRRIGEYLIWSPPVKPGQRIGAIVFVHGWRMDAATVMRDSGMMQVARELGVALVAPRGLSGAWNFPGAPQRGGQRRDEFVFFEALRQDLIMRRGVDEDSIMVAGFSTGASMAWSLACHDGQRYMGFATVAGAFWRPIPVSCPSPARFLAHTHGEVDTVSPINGRDEDEPAGPASVWDSFDILTAGASRLRHEARTDQRGFLCTGWGRRTGRREEAYYEFCRHGGGHKYAPSWFERAWRMIHGRAEG